MIKFELQKLFLETKNLISKNHKELKIMNFFIILIVVDNFIVFFNGND